MYHKVTFEHDPYGYRTYWVDDEGNEYPFNPEQVEYEERLWAWESRENDYPLDDYGYAYCASCGKRVTFDNFAHNDDNPAHKDYCADCAERDDDRDDRDPMINLPSDDSGDYYDSLELPF